MKLFKASAFLILATTLAAGTAEASSIPAVTTSATNGTGVALFGSTPFSTTVGWEFNVAGFISVSSLGVFDSDENGLLAGHAVGIWKCSNPACSTGALVVSDTVVSADPLLGGTAFRYHDIFPVILAPGNYMIGAFMQAAGDRYLTDAPGFSVASGITMLNSQTGFFSPASSSLLFPSINGIFGAPDTFGPNFQFTSVPEPGTLSLAALGLGALVSMRRRTAK